MFVIIVSDGWLP